MHGGFLGRSRGRIRWMMVIMRVAFIFLARGKSKDSGRGNSIKEEFFHRFSIKLQSSIVA